MVSSSFAPSGEILEFNAAAEAMFGRRREDVIGLNVADIIMPEALRQAHDRNLVHYVERQTNGVIAERVEMPAMRAGRQGVPRRGLTGSRSTSPGNCCRRRFATSPIVSSSKSSSGSRRSCRRLDSWPAASPMISTTC